VIPVSQKLTILVPAYQDAKALANHSKSLGFLRDLNVRIVWVVSPSPDGTEVIARRIADSAGDLFCLSAKGLYQSWNFGITQVNTPFFAISSIGDTYINDGVLRMLDLLIRHGADICFSPPQAMTGSSSPSVTDWPVHRFRRRLGCFHCNIVPTRLLVLLQLQSGLDSLLGSWASIVGRSETLRRNPFPLEYGHHGDTAWCFQSLPRLRCVFYDREVATFKFHCTSSLFTSLQLFKQYRILGHQMLQMYTQTTSQTPSFSYVWRKYFVFLHLLNKGRGKKPHRGWWLSWTNWKYRCLRDFFSTCASFYFFFARFPR